MNPTFKTSDGSFGFWRQHIMTVMCFALNLSKDNSKSCHFWELSRSKRRFSNVTNGTAYLAHGLWQVWWRVSVMTITSLIEDSKRTPYGFEVRRFLLSKTVLWGTQTLILTAWYWLMVKLEGFPFWLKMTLSYETRITDQVISG